MQTVPGLNFMIGGRDTCKVKFFPFRYIRDTEFFQGDSGGPLWVREKKKGENLPIAYLVSISTMGNSLDQKKDFFSDHPPTLTRHANMDQEATICFLKIIDQEIRYCKPLL